MTPGTPKVSKLPPMADVPQDATTPNEIPITKVLIAGLLTTITNVDPIMKIDKTLSVFSYPYSEEIVRILAAYSMDLPIQIHPQKFERTYFRLRNLMYQSRPVRSPSAEGR